MKTYAQRLTDLRRDVLNMGISPNQQNTIILRIDFLLGTTSQSRLARFIPWLQVLRDVGLSKGEDR